MPPKQVKKVVLAYSGGLDTSIILKWLQTTYGCEVVTFTADLGQGEELEPARDKAELLGIKPENIFIEDLREEFVRDYVFPMFRANAHYEGLYLLGTSIARPLIAKKQIEIAERARRRRRLPTARPARATTRSASSSAYYALKPDVTVIAPWREWDLRSREQLIDFAEKNQIPIAKDKRGEAPFSVDANLLHSSSEGKVLEDPAAEVPDYVYSRTISPEEAPDTPTDHHDRLREGRRGRDRRRGAVARDAADEAQRARPRQRHRPARPRREPLRRHEVAAACTRRRAARSCRSRTGRIESITLDRGAAHLKDELMPKYAELIYNGFWFSPEREMLQALIDKSPGAGHRHGAAEALQGRRARASAARARTRSTTRTSSPSRRAPSPTTTATRPASSSSTRCGCARWRSGRRSSGSEPRAVARSKRRSPEAVPRASIS